VIGWPRSRNRGLAKETITMLKQIAFVSLFAAAAITTSACNVGPADQTALDADAPEGDFVDESQPVDGKADTNALFSERCRKRAVNAVGILEKQNKATSKVKKVTLGSGEAQSDLRLRVELDRTLNGKKSKDVYLVDLYEQEDTCQLTGIRSEKKTVADLYTQYDESEPPIVAPSQACAYAAKKAVNSIVADNDYEVPQYALKVYGFVSQKDNLVRVLVAEDLAEEWGGSWIRPWAVKTEPFGKSGCFVWGMQDNVTAPIADDNVDEGEQ
jgi:hypothetical protein